MVKIAESVESKIKEDNDVLRFINKVKSFIDYSITYFIKYQNVECNLSKCTRFCKRLIPIKKIQKR